MCIGTSQCLKTTKKNRLWYYCSNVELNYWEAKEENPQEEGDEQGEQHEAAFKPRMDWKCRSKRKLNDDGKNRGG